MCVVVGTGGSAVDREVSWLTLKASGCIPELWSRFMRTSRTSMLVGSAGSARACSQEDQIPQSRQQAEGLVIDGGDGIAREVNPSVLLRGAEQNTGHTISLLLLELPRPSSCLSTGQVSQRSTCTRVKPEGRT